jgi:nitrogen regulatory protein PII
MHSVKRLEIISTSLQLEKLIKKLDAAGVPGYSVIRNVVGRGHDGEVSTDSDFASTTLSNIYIVSFCSDEQVNSVLSNIQPILKRYGGVCYVSDAVKISS